MRGKVGVGVLMVAFGWGVLVCVAAGEEQEKGSGEGERPLTQFDCTFSVRYRASIFCDKYQ